MVNIKVKIKKLLGIKIDYPEKAKRKRKPIPMPIAPKTNPGTTTIRE